MIKERNIIYLHTIIRVKRFESVLYIRDKIQTVQVVPLNNAREAVS